MRCAGLSDAVCAYFSDREVGIVRASLNGSFPPSPVVMALPRPGLMSWRASANEVWWLDARGSIRKAFVPFTASDIPTLNSYSVYSQQEWVFALQSPNVSPGGLLVLDALNVVLWSTGSVYSGSTAGGNVTQRITPPTARTIKGLAIDAAAQVVYFTSQADPTLSTLTTVHAVNLSLVLGNSAISASSSAVWNMTMSGLPSSQVVSNIVVNGSSVNGSGTLYILVNNNALPKLISVNTSSNAVVTFANTYVITFPRDLCVYNSSVFIMGGATQFVDATVSLAQVWRVDVSTNAVVLIVDSTVPTIRGGISVDIPSALLLWSDGHAIRAVNLISASTVSASNALLHATLIQQAEGEALPPFSLGVTPDGLLAWGTSGALGQYTPDVSVADQSGWQSSTLDGLLIQSVKAPGMIPAEFFTFHPDYHECTAYLASFSHSSIQSVEFCGASPVITNLSMSVNTSGIAATSTAVSFSDESAKDYDAESFAFI